QTIRLASGSERVEFDCDVRWETRGASLKAAFPLAASNPEATYNWSMGTVRRSNNNEKKYEVPSHQWFDLTNIDGSHGATIIEDSKYGSDKPDDNTLRLTLIYTPKPMQYHDQGTQDIGTHECLYALYGHEGDWRVGNSHWQARRVNQPVRAFEVGKHSGPLGRSFSFLTCSSDQVEIRTVKKAEASDELIVRLQELHGTKSGPIEIAAARPIISAREVDGQERPLGPAV